MNWIIISWSLFFTLTGCVNCEKSAWNCEFDEASMGVSLDLSKLYNNQHDYIIHHDIKNETLRMQLCGPLKKNCNGIPGYSACLQINNEIEKGLGRIPEATHEDGRIMFKYIGDRCKDNINYTLYVLMKCNYDADNSSPETYIYDDNQCVFYVYWQTILACARYSHDPVPLVNCSVTHPNGNIFNLSDLKKLDDNYVVPIDGNSSIILNVCHPVVYGYGAVCPDDVGACLRNNSDSPRYKNIGSVNSLKLNGNSLVLNYGNGAVCPVDGNHMQTTISFVCDFKANNTEPVFLKSEKCHYELTWRTAAACNEKDLIAYTRSTASPCKITNPITNFEYNLDSLKGEDYIIKAKNDVEYKFSICGPLLSSFCRLKSDDSKQKIGAGVCSSSHHLIGGIANSKLLWNLIDGPYLNYTNGTPCDKNKKSSTIIKFICAPEESRNLDMIDTEDLCNLKIHYHTPLVCEKKRHNIMCDIGSELDKNNLCINNSLIQTILPTNSTEIVDASLTTDIISILSVVAISMFSVFLTLTYLNKDGRQYLRHYCCSWCTRKTNIRMQYSRINLVEETDALLDTPDTHCQSNSDDDLLTI